MRFTTTDGQTRDVADMCAYCEMSTGGQHEVHCSMAEGYQEMAELIAEEFLPIQLEVLPEYKEEK